MDQSLTGKQQELLGLLRDGFVVYAIDAVYIWLDPPKGDDRDRQMRSARTYRFLVGAGFWEERNDD